MQAEFDLGHRPDEETRRRVVARRPSVEAERDRCGEPVEALGRQARHARIRAALGRFEDLGGFARESRECPRPPGLGVASAANSWSVETPPPRHASLIKRPPAELFCVAPDCACFCGDFTIDQVSRLDNVGQGAVVVRRGDAMEHRHPRRRPKPRRRCDGTRRRHVGRRRPSRRRRGSKPRAASHVHGARGLGLRIESLRLGHAVRVPRGPTRRHSAGEPRAAR